MQALFREISNSGKWRAIQPLNKGWSDDKKYHIVTDEGTPLLLRISDISKYEVRKKDYETLKRLDDVNVLISRPIDFGVFNNAKNIYFLLTWIEGIDVEDLLVSLSTKEQYDLGMQAGKTLRGLHSMAAPPNIISWENRFNRKINRNINRYRSCGIEIPSADNIIDFIEKNRFLLENRPQTFQHGDYHLGNMILTKSKQLGVIDFDRLDYGDPWEEFNRIVWCAHASSSFASGRINGYFENSVPEEFFRLMALYIASNLLSSVPWAIAYGEEQVNIMLNQTREVLTWFDQFQIIIPTWYKSNLQQSI